MGCVLVIFQGNSELYRARARRRIVGKQIKVQISAKLLCAREQREALPKLGKPPLAHIGRSGARIYDPRALPPACENHTGPSAPPCRQTRYLQMQVKYFSVCVCVRMTRSWRSRCLTRRSQSGRGNTINLTSQDTQGIKN